MTYPHTAESKLFGNACNQLQEKLFRRAVTLDASCETPAPCVLPFLTCKVAKSFMPVPEEDMWDAGFDKFDTSTESCCSNLQIAKIPMENALSRKAKGIEEWLRKERIINSS